MFKITIFTMFASFALFADESTAEKQAAMKANPVTAPNPYYQDQFNPYYPQNTQYNPHTNIDHAQTFITEQYYGITQEQNIPILKLKIEYIEKLGKNASKESKDKLLKKYEEKVGKLLVQFNKENESTAAARGTSTPVIGTAFPTSHATPFDQYYRKDNLQGRRELQSYLELKKTNKGLSAGEEAQLKVIARGGSDLEISLAYTQAMGGKLSAGEKAQLKVIARGGSDLEISLAYTQAMGGKLSAGEEAQLKALNTKIFPGDAFCDPDPEEKECVTPDGRSYKFDKGVNNLSRFPLIKKDDTAQVPKEIPNNSGHGR